MMRPAAKAKRPAAVLEPEPEEDVFQESESEHNEVFFGIISIEFVSLDF